MLISEVADPSADGFGKCKEPVCEAGADLVLCIFMNVEEPGTERRIEPLLCAGGKKVHTKPGKIERDRAELLNRVNDKKTSTLLCQLREHRQIHAQPVDPLHRADEQHARVCVNQVGVIINRDDPAPVAGDANFYTPEVLCMLRTDGDLRIFKITEDKVAVMLIDISR